MLQISSWVWMWGVLHLTRIYIHTYRRATYSNVSRINNCVILVAAAAAARVKHNF